MTEEDLTSTEGDPEDVDLVVKFLDTDGRMTTGERSTTRRKTIKQQSIDPVFVLLIDKARAKGNTYIYGCQCNERLKAKTEGSTRLTYTGWVGWGTGTPTDRDEVTRREV